MKRLVILIITTGMLLSTLCLSFHSVQLNSLATVDRHFFLAPFDPPESDAIPISTYEELDAIRYSLSGNYYLKNDIDLVGKEWVPIGNARSPFTGTFDGQGFSIRNMTITDGSHENIGLFAAIASRFSRKSPVIKNIGMNNLLIDVRGREQSDTIWLGSIAGTALSGAESIISNCYSMGVITVQGYGSGCEVGGIVGRSEGYISYCYNLCSISVGTEQIVANVGGIAGSSSVSKCYNSGSISVIGLSDLRVGGIAGESLLIENCYNTGSISAVATGDRHRDVNSYIGGILGYRKANINFCYNTGNIEFTSQLVEIAIRTIPYNVYVGGITGSDIASLPRGCVTLSPSIVSNVGGAYSIGGWADQLDNLSVAVGNSVNNDTTRTISAAEASLQATYEAIGWDFNDIWQMSGGEAPLPVFKNQNATITTAEPETGYSLVTLQYGGNSGEIVAAEVVWGDNLFVRGSENMEWSREWGHLAYIASVLSAAVYRNENGYSYGSEDYFVRHDLEQLGFDKDTIHTVQNIGYNFAAHTFGHKKITVSGVEYDLIAIVIRGTDGFFGFATDLSVMLNPLNLIDHSGFDAVRNDVYTGLQQYLKDIGMINNERTKYFITGHSLGGATANLLAAQLGEDATLKTNIYTFTFATPNVTMSPNAWIQSSYAYIYNFVNPGDPITNMPPPPLWFRFGKNFRFFTPGIEWLDAHYLGPYVEYAKSLATFEPADYTPRYIMTHFTVECPVDVEIYDRSGNLLGKTIYGEMDWNTARIVLYTIGDVKHIFMPEDTEYLVRFIGYGEGEMDCSIEQYDIDTGTTERKKIFSNVELQPGKTMEVSVNSFTFAEETRLFIIDDMNVIIGEIQENGLETEVNASSANVIMTWVITGISALFIMTIAGVLFIQRRRSVSH